MKANELRIGNLITFGAMRHECKPCDILNLYQSEIAGTQCDEYQPIPLTEEWLKRFGFTKYQWTDAYFIHTKFGDLMVRFLEGKIYTHFTNVYADQKGMMMKGRRYVGNLNSTQNITHVHTLQNLYFALIGQELITKN